ncbi:type II CAAX endopeptidase family protein [Mycetocola sp. 2940]|uniref:CPBP family intramembrane glutamic endopeptidase n=1 Tax=Mycetocola sp. 2940 TaxID=3156452 RepID=UPI00339AF788
MQWSIRDAVAGFALAVLLVGLVGTQALRAWPPSAEWQVALSYLAAWLPMLGAVLVASYLHGRRSLALDFGLRFSWLDILYGLTLGFFLRSIVTLIEILGYGGPAGGAVRFGPVDYNLVWMLLAVVAPILVAPVIEELFFRGLLQRSVLNASKSSIRGSSRFPMVLAVAMSSITFAVVHMLQTGGGAQTVVVGLATLILGIGLGTLAAITGRLGGAIIAHIVFNGLGVLGTLL